jgi:hypothetical protein
MVDPVPGITVTAPVSAQLSWEYEPRHNRIAALYEHGKRSQWNATTDIDWSVDVQFGSPLPDESGFGLATYESSPLASFGRPAWDAFRWEFQCWMLSQFLHGEQGALVATARLAECHPDVEAKLFAANQVGDEARHVEVFARYLRDKIGFSYEISSPLAALLEDTVGDSRWDITALGMQIIIEGLAMAAFRVGAKTFHDPLVRQITTLVARDEARHISFGILSLEGFYDEMTTAERADREHFVLEAASAMRRRFLLEDIWERMGVDVAVGSEFAATSAVMISYRHALFAKVISALARIGLMTDAVREGFEKLDLLHGRRLKPSLLGVQGSLDDTADHG